MGPYRPLNIPTVETDSQVILDKASSTGPLLTTRIKPLPTPRQANVLQPQSDFCFSISSPHLPPAPYITWILSPHTNDFTWTWFDLLSPHTSDLTSRWGEPRAALPLFLFTRDGNFHGLLLTSVQWVPVSRSVFVLRPASSPRAG